ncbi:MAG TPA: TIGR03435 family protein [Candidatus Aquilonibacter sp.]|nr:TIGR03435 family protein [Candidatus Aquilonibacter sp.]
MKLSRCSSGLLLVVSAASALAVPIFAGKQSPTTLPSFDVASVKPDDPNDPIRGYRQLDAGGRIVYRAYTLRQLVMEAYRLQSYQLSGGPSWVDSEMFNIEAKPPEASDAAKINPSDPKTAPPSDELLMLRSLLETRFQLLLSKEQRDGTVYSLEPVSSGIKWDQFRTPEHPEERPLVTSGREEETTQEGVNYDFTGRNATMALLVEQLERRLNAPVKDDTGLTGNFDFVLHYTYDDSLAGAKYPAIPSALQEQFGLRLKAEKGPVDHYVISHAEQPSLN